MFESIAEAVFHYAGTQPDRLCLADDTGRVTWREYADRILNYAGLFRQEGIEKGGCVVIEACQTIDYLAQELALHLLGSVFVPVEHNCAQQKIADFAQRAKACAVISCAEGAFDTEKAFTHKELAGRIDRIEPLKDYSFPGRETVSEILFSTGTTGREKGIVITHANDIALAENVMYGVEMERDNVEMILSPMNHSHGLRRYYANMVNGSSVVLLGSAMNMMLFMRNLDEYGVSSVDMVPSALSVVLRLSRGKLADYQDQLRYIQFGAAPMAEADMKAICTLLPQTRLYNFYGSTESGCIAIYNFNCPDSKRGCVGKPTRNACIFMVDDERRRITSCRDNPGLLASSGEMNMLGYWEDPEETDRVLLDGAVYSNDIAYFDADGDIILLGRKGDVINVGGHKVSPEEIENTAKAMKEIADCGVIPADDPFKGSVPRLFVQMKAGCAFEPGAIRTFLSERLEQYKVPVYIEKIDKIPRSYNGKLLRKNLKEL